MRNFQILIVSAIKISKQYLQTVSASGLFPRTPTGASYPTGGLPSSVIFVNENENENGQNEKITNSLTKTKTKTKNDEN